MNREHLSGEMTRRRLVLKSCEWIWAQVMGQSDVDDAHHGRELVSHSKRTILSNPTVPLRFPFAFLGIARFEKHIWSCGGFLRATTHGQYNVSTAGFSYLSLLQSLCDTILWQTLRFSSELKSGIPKHSSRGTHSSSLEEPMLKRSMTFKLSSFFNSRLWWAVLTYPRFPASCCRPHCSLQ